MRSNIFDNLMNLMEKQATHYRWARDELHAELCVLFSGDPTSLTT